MVNESDLFAKFGRARFFSEEFYPYALYYLGRTEPDAETVEQTLAYRMALARRPDWNHPVAATVVEVCGSEGDNWFDLA